MTPNTNIAGWLVCLILAFVGLFAALQIRHWFAGRESDGACRVVVAEPRPTLDEVAEPHCEEMIEVRQSLRGLK